MNSAPTNHADTKAGLPVRSALRVVLACALVLGASVSAYAQQHDRHDDQGYQPEHHSERFQLPREDREQRMADMRAYEEQRRAQQQYQQQQQQQERDNRRSSRLTPDERRDLRRQINEANMDLYPQRR